MRLSKNQGNGIILFSIVVAMALRILPWGHDFSLLNPDWILLVVLYWSLMLPDRFNIGAAWFVGLLTDALTGQLLGQYALSYSLIAYIAIRLHQRIRAFPISQQILVILTLQLMSQLLIFWIKNIQGSVMINWTYWVPSFSGALLWPLIYLILGGVNQKIRIG